MAILTGETGARALPAPAEDTPWLDESEMAAWVALLGLVDKLPQALDRQLRRDVGIGHTYYAMLHALSAEPDRALTMGRLARATFMTPSRLSHAVSAMERRGWVGRRPCPHNGRIQYAFLTDDGVDTLARVAPGHLAEARRRVFDHLTGEQVDQLRSIAETLVAAIDVDADTPDPPQGSGS